MSTLQGIGPQKARFKSTMQRRDVSKECLLTRSGLSMAHEGLGGGEVQGHSTRQAGLEQHRGSGANLDGVSQ